ncbi:MAG TPA: hypothetical protein VJ937_01440 [Salinivirga sp.]|uniref:hypothetical protein n=1 Tax=Salinivirga sp. TaxID=1970192 RepID=UPI002B46AB9A|nr:hypothetical protein [Salinivirga sp.]HKK58115.1 hypothetical protein [Salinivirga sp.]
MILFFYWVSSQNLLLDKRYGCRRSGVRARDEGGFLFFTGWEQKTGMERRDPAWELRNPIWTSDAEQARPQEGRPGTGE